MACTIALVDLGPRHQLPPMLTNQARDIGQRYWAARGGAASAEHPVHVLCVWEAHDGTRHAERVWGLATAWTEMALHVVLHRHGEWHSWMLRSDVQRCDCLAAGCAVVVPVDDDPRARVLAATLAP